MAQPIELPSWPNGADVAVSLTFDVDAECGWLGEGEEYARRLTTLSEGRFSVVRGLPRILDVLRDTGVSGTFYVPGDTAERHTERLAGLLADGHEIGHHGHMHLRSDKIDAAAQREEIERGLEALERHLGVRPTGYRSASWELTPETFELLLEFGFDYDSSCMGDDRPYIEEHEGSRILELPVHWSLDDWPHFAWTIEGGGVIGHPDTVLEIWLAEFESALADRRHVTFTMHPEVIGRGYRIQVLRRLIEEAGSRANVWFATHAEVAAHVGAGVPDRA
ncbi:MAG: peptidoglycan-N-acetylglucosamine deacetylase [Gaiellaceae bacterium]|jgi:peptidoglycan/xylan/chitin deacetylase (PgdA/CDA1 family)|nr:peptidoglycan-N-acetylglucosamine deacetylase [Gaiellaceae bacterium]